MSFTYNDSGIRTSKTINGVTTTYYLDGSKIVGEETNGNITVYFYDSLGLPIGFGYHASTYGLDVFDVYWYEKNLQGDIVAIYNQAGTKIVSYHYDAWGACYTTNVASSVPSVVTNNPFRYRGYYYDIDLGLYYLNARYYDAGIGRFISPDSLGYLGANGDLNSYNLFAYCSNNPVMYADPSGHSIIAAIIIGAIIGASIGFGATVYKDYEDDGEVFNGSVDAIDYVANTVVGGIVGSATGALASSIAPAIGSFLSTSFSFSSPFALAGGEAIAITVTGAQLVGAGASAVAIGVALFASNNRPKDNRKQNEQFRSAMRELNITDKDKMRRVHDQIKGKNMGYRQLIDFIKEILNIP